MDIVFISNLEVEACIGIHAWERKIRQRLVLNLELETDITRAAKDDDIHKALDYDAVCQCLIREIEASDFQLIETLAEHLIQALFRDFSIPWIRLRLSKPGAVRAAKEVGIQIERQRTPK